MSGKKEKLISNPKRKQKSTVLPQLTIFNDIGLLLVTQLFN